MGPLYFKEKCCAYWSKVFGSGDQKQTFCSALIEQRQWFIIRVFDTSPSLSLLSSGSLLLMPRTCCPGPGDIMAWITELLCVLYTLHVRQCLPAMQLALFKELFSGRWHMIPPGVTEDLLLRLSLKNDPLTGSVIDQTASYKNSLSCTRLFRREFFN